jgi:dienelactone hydrolase
MLRATLLPFFLLGSLLSSGIGLAQAPSAKDVDILAPDGTKLRATFFPAAKAGPGVLLMHMCVTTRKSWEPVAKELSAAGINVLTIDNRGFGESGGPRYEGASPEVQQQLTEKWPGDFDAAYQFLSNHEGVDAARIGAGGGSCGVDNAVKLAERHSDIKVLVLLAGTTDLKGIDFVLHHPEITLFTAAAADDQYITDAPQLMRWFSELSGNPHNKFETFPNGRHGTEIFGPHPELVHQIVAFFVENLLTPPSASAMKTTAPQKTLTADFWTQATEPGGAARAAQLFHDMRKRDPGAYVFPEGAMNMLGYERLQKGNKAEAIEFFKLNVEAYPASANTEDSLGDAYEAAGEKELALAAEEKCLELLPGDPSSADFKALLRSQAEEKIKRLRSDKK